MSEYLLATLEIRLGLDSTYARQKAREIAELLGFDRNDQTRIATAVSEIARNAWQHGGGGTAQFTLADHFPQAFQVRIADQGPGIDHIDEVLTGKCASAFGGGKSVLGASCIMDDFSVETAPGVGTTITMRKTLPPRMPRFETDQLDALVSELASRPPLGPLDELHRQNQELLQALQQVQEQQTNWERLYREMEITNRDMLSIHDELSEQNQALNRSEAQIRQMVGEVRDYAIFLLDAKGCIVTWNVGAERTLGYTEAEIVGQPGALVFPAEYRDRPAQEMLTARRVGRTEEEDWYVRKDGSRFWANSVLTVLRDSETVTGYVKILRDITSRKQAEDSLQDAYRRERHITEVLQSPLIQGMPEDALPGLSVVTLYESALDEAEVGGDFFDAFTLADGQAVLAVGDASGKGLAAALRAMQVKQLLRAAFALVADPSPSRVVTQLNQYLSRNDEPEFPGFVTLALVVLNVHTGQGISVSAGCEPPLLLSKSGEAQSLHASAPPLGVIAESCYRDLPFALAPDDTLVLMTDGITEARLRGKMLEYDGMISLAVQGLSAPTLRDMGTTILEGARAFAGGVLRDDACLLLARPA